MTEAPSSWTSVRLADVAQTQLGKMLSKKSKTGVGSRPYLKNKNVQWGHIDLEGLPEMDFTSAELEKFRLLPGDVLVCEGGEVGRAAIWRGQLADCTYQKALHRVRCDPTALLPEYLLYLLMHYSDSQLFEPYVTGTTIRHLPQEDLRVLPVPLAPLEEQRRIVDAIEEQFSRIDAAEAALRRAAAKTTSHRIAALAEVYDQDWPRRRVSDIAETQLGKMLSEKSKRGLSPVPYLRNKNVRWESVDVADVGEMDFTPEEVTKFRLVAGDILICEGGAGVGRTGVWRDELELCCYQKALHRVRPGPELVPQFFVYFMRYLVESRRLDQHLSGVAIGHFPQEDLRTLEVPCPPRVEQERLVERLDRHSSVAEALVRDLASAQQKSAVLRRVLLAEAFAGRLVDGSKDESRTHV